MQSGAAKNFTVLTESEVSTEFCRSLKPDDFTVPEDARDHKSHKAFIVVDAGGMYEARNNLNNVCRARNKSNDVIF